jgi:hypothetical protein
MSEALARWNGLTVEDAAKEVLPCCGSTAWAEEMARRPFADLATLLAASDETWRNLPAEDWMEAFLSHPRIDESQASLMLIIKLTVLGGRIVGAYFGAGEFAQEDISLLYSLAGPKPQESELSG